MRKLAIALSLLAVAALEPTEARACGGFDFGSGSRGELIAYSVTEHERLLDFVEELVGTGAFNTAAAVMAGRFPQRPLASWNHNPLVDRTLELLALTRR